MPTRYDVIHDEKYEIELCDINADDLVMETTVDETDLTGLGHIKLQFMVVNHSDTLIFIL